ncbi:helix-turn-helix transcriptional regulator [Nocardia paucivorans]|uniref:helix-turn-helix transcriptional regulator n=1 Tax=Nocardia paucivorans TaxID=114259 RepID=UPI00031089AA|nr:AAA family ATPase [Nocardia paucivorans]
MVSPDREEVPLVGRVEEMGVLREALVEARDGAATTVAVTGEPGIGKSRLLAETVQRAVELGFQVFEGRGTELERALPYAVVIDALDGPAGSLRRSELRELGGDNIAELGRLLPSLNTWATPLRTTLQVERHRCHRAVHALLQRLVARRPALLVLDDVHWADHASIEVIAHLLRHRISGLTLVIAHRARQLPQTHSALLSRAVYDRTLTELELGPLSLDDAAKLLSGRFDHDELSRLHYHCGGNPFYLQEIARSRQSTIPSDLGTADPSGVPDAIKAAITREVRSLSDEGRRLLHAAAVAGGVFDIDLAVEIAELDEEPARSATDEIVHAGLVHSTATPGRLAFRHPILRLALYESIGYGRRRQAHRRAAAALEHRPSALSIRAHHLEQAGDIGDAEAIAVLTRAGASAAPRAPVAAARWFRAALRLLPDDAPTEQRLSLMLALADALSSTGRLDACGAVLREILTIIPPEALGDRAGIMARIALAEQGVGNSWEGKRLLTTALSMTPPDSLTAATLRLELAKNHLMMRQWEEASRIVRQVQRSAEVRHDRRLYLMATAASAYMGTMQSGDSLVHARNYLHEAVSALDALNDNEVAPDLLDGLTNVVYAEISMERWESAIAHADRGIRLSRDTGHGRHLVELQHLRALGYKMQGMLEPGLAAATSAVDTAHMLGNSPIVALTEATRCWLLLLMGRTAASLESGALAMQVNAQAPDALFAWHPPLIYGCALIEAGRYRQGCREIRAIDGGEELGAMYPTTMPHFYRFLVEGELALGRVEAAERTTRYIESIVDGMAGLHMRMGDARYSRARMHLVRKNVPAALTAASDAVAAYEASGTRAELARAQLLFGQVLTEHGDTAAARREFEQALVTAEQCGAARLAERARLSLHRSGARTPRGKRNGSHETAVRLDDLTERQAEIIARVVLGRTNRQISEELYVSEKTVEAHLTRLYTKLGVSSRTELAALAAANEHLR